MGSEANCRVRAGGREVRGKARLETDHLAFSSPDLKLRFPLLGLRVGALNGELTVRNQDGSAVFVLGDLAETWAKKILHPKSRLEKLGLKPGHRVCVLGVVDPELSGYPTEPLSECDLLFLAAERRKEMKALSKFLRPDGAIWLIRPRATISEKETLAAGQAAGLVDVKVVRFSDTHSAEKYVIPLARRKRWAGASASRARTRGSPRG